MASTFKSNCLTTSRVISLLCITLALFVTAVVTQSQDGSRQIVLAEFTRERPPAPPTAKNNSTQRSKPSALAGTQRLSHYRRATKPLTTKARTPRLPGTEIGVTIWRLRPSRPEDDAGARLLVMQDDNQTQWTPERIEADTYLKVGDRVRISIEAPRNGYLYVVDREQYADGSVGDAYLIFPTKRTHGGDNRVRPGKLIDIPAQEDNPNYFTLVPSPSRKDQVGETLSVILTPQPLPELLVSEKPLQIPASDLLQWEKLWGTAFERFEMEGGAGLAWTKEEREAAMAKGTRYLTQAEPTPQTIYRLAGGSKNSLLVTVKLSYRNR